MQEKELNDSMKLYLEKLKEEYASYSKLHELAKNERDAIDSFDIQKLNKIITEKQKVLDHVQSIDIEIKNLRELWQTAKDLIDPALSQDIKEFLEQFAGFMKDLLAFQDENERMFVEKNKLSEKEFREVKQARKANQAYGNQIPTPQSRTDLKG